MRHYFRLKYFILLIFCGCVVSAYSQRADSVSYLLQSQHTINTKGSETSPCFFENGIIFLSNRDKGDKLLHYSNTDGSKLNDLYRAVYNNKGELKSVKQLPSAVSGYFNEGPASYCALTKTLYFTRSESLKPGVKSAPKLRIYTSQYNDDGSFSEPEKLNVTAEKYSAGHPSISKNGNILFFASDMPGGYGGTDLYVCYNKSGKWTKPVNVGPEVNTSGNELFPFIHPDGMLYFASDGHTGMGGLDIFKSAYKNLEWVNSVSLGQPFNSPAEDFGFIVSDDNMSGFFSSDRYSPGNYDIFKFSNSGYRFINCDTLQNISLCKTFFEEGSMTADSLPLVYEWDLGDNHKVRGSEVSHCFPGPGTYLIQLNVVDLITGQVFFNEATYELVIDSIKGLYFNAPDTVYVGDKVTFDASVSVALPGVVIEELHWDFGDGSNASGAQAAHVFLYPGSYLVRLQGDMVQKNMLRPQSCVARPVYVKPTITKSLAPVANYVNISGIAKPIYTIKDKKGNEYKIQIATSNEPIRLNSKIFEDLGDISEYEERGVYGYTLGSFGNLSDSYPELKKVRLRGFNEAVVIAMNNGTVISGSDSSFYAELPEGFVPIKIVTLNGKVRDTKGNPVNALITWEDLEKRKILGETSGHPQTGAYELHFSDGGFYGYFAHAPGYYPVSNFLDLRQKNDLAEIKNDIIMVSLEEMSQKEVSFRANNIFFSKGSFTIEQESMPELQRLAGFLNDNTDIKLEISGHTDDLGEDDFNFQISEKRAEAVKIKLIELGCLPSQLVSIGYGESKPLVKSTDKNAREINRRVEFKFVK